MLLSEDSRVKLSTHFQKTGRWAPDSPSSMTAKATGGECSWLVFDPGGEEQEEANSSEERITGILISRQSA